MLYVYNFKVKAGRTGFIFQKTNRDIANDLESTKGMRLLGDIVVEVAVVLTTLVTPAFKIEDKTILVLMDILYQKSSREQRHSQRVSQLCFDLAGCLGFSRREKVELGKIGLLHDIGKLAISSDILNKPAALSDDEWQEMEQHPDNGYRFLSAVPGMLGVAEAIFAHHERWDGTGYPRGLRGRQIPVEARIVSVVDAYDAMISPRPYRQAFSPRDAMLELDRCAKFQFDPDIVVAFLDLIAQKDA